MNGPFPAAIVRDMPKARLDAIDQRIIGELQADARLSNVDLADRVGLSPSPCLRRVKRLEQQGVIQGYRAVLNRDSVGLGFSAFLAVKIEGHANEHAMAFEADLEHYRHFLVERLLSLSIVREVRSNISIQTRKAAAPLPLEQPR